MVRRVAIFGSGGQLGAELDVVFGERGWETACFGRSDVDITDPEAVAKAVAGFEPAVVVNAAAYNQVDIAEREPLTAFQVNGLAVRNLALASGASQARLVHFSTDYVFDGQAGEPYPEDAATHPLGAYAVSKLAGELYAQAYLERPLIIRTSGVYGPAGLVTARGNFPELMLRLASEDKPIRVVEDHVASPTYAPALAARSVDLLERDASGLFHIGGGTPISWYDWARKIFKAAGVEARLTPTNEAEFQTAARRPKYSALSNRKMEELGIAAMPGLDEALAEYLELRKRRLEK